MSLGVLNNISAIYAENSLTSTQASLQTTLQQLSSGSRINSGADDAAGLSIANGLAANSAALTQSSANATDGVGLLQVADGALSQVTSLLNRAITLATEAGNGTLDTSQLAAAQQEYGDILGEINTIGGSTVFNGNAVFSTATTNVFTSDGTKTGTTLYNVGAGTLSTVSGVGVTAPGATTTGTSNTLTALQITPGGASQAYTAASAGVDVLSDAASADNVAGSVTIYVGTTPYAISVAATAGESLNNLAAQIQTALGSAGTAAVTAAGSLTITSATPGVADSITVGNSSLYDVTGSAAVANAVTAGTDQLAYAAATSDLYTITADSANDTFTNNGLSVTIGGVTTNVSFTGTAGGTAGTDTVANLVTDLNTALGATATAAATGGVITITASASGSAADFTIGGSVNDILATPTGGSSGSASAGQLLSGTNLSTHSAATTALQDVYNAIADVAYQRGTIGANINTLTAVSNVETTQNVNVASAENSITATDYGAATSNLSKYEILSQTGISALAQANSVQQEVLKLLQ
jgi:flagellin